MANILVLHGPNLNLLGTREPEVYGSMTINTIDSTLHDRAKARGHRIFTLQSNAEHELIDRIHNSNQDNIKFIIFNPAAFTHTSIAIRDALTAVEIPFIEVHLSNLYQRESFRHRSYFSDIAQGIICGFGPSGYYMALDAAFTQLDY